MTRKSLWTMQANVDNYRKADELPNMSLFTWFFVVPGLLLVGLGGLGLFADRKRTPSSTAIPTAMSVDTVLVSSSH
jgi:hypothetical protein